MAPNAAKTLRNSTRILSCQIRGATFEVPFFTSKNGEFQSLGFRQLSSCSLFVHAVFFSIKSLPFITFIEMGRTCDIISFYSRPELKQNEVQLNIPRINVIFSSFVFICRLFALTLLFLGSIIMNDVKLLMSTC